MKAAVNRIVLIGILTAIIIGSGGCFQMMGEAAHDKTVKEFPTYTETKAAWGTVPDGYGRVVLFIEKLGINPFSPVSGSGYTSFIYEVDSSVQTGMPDQTFVFIDLPAGKHFFNCYPVGSSYHGKPTEFDVIAGKTMYINAGLKMATGREAENQLEKMHHNFKNALPFDKQSKSAKSAWSSMMGTKGSASTAPDELVVWPVAPAANNMLLEGSVNVKADVPIIDNGRYYVRVQKWVDNSNLRIALEKAVTQNGLFTQAEQGNTDYVLNVWVEKIESNLEIFGEGFMIDMTSVWRLTRTKDGKILVCDFVKGHGASHAAGRSAHEQSLIAATRETIQKGLLMLSDQSGIHMNALAVAGSRPSQ
jgi:hypothetical protein